MVNHGRGQELSEAHPIPPPPLATPPRRPALLGALSLLGILGGLVSSLLAVALWDRFRTSGFEPGVLVTSGLITWLVCLGLYAGRYWAWVGIQILWAVGLPLSLILNPVSALRYVIIIPLWIYLHTKRVTDFCSRHPAMHTQPGAAQEAVLISTPAGIAGYLVASLCLPAIFALERSAYYALRSVFLLLATRPVPEGGLGLELESARDALTCVSHLGLLAPLLGGTVALCCGARATMIIGAVITAASYGSLNLASDTTLTVAVVLWGIGQGLFVPALYAVLGQEVAHRNEALRIAPFLVLHVAIQLGASAGAFAGPLLFKTTLLRPPYALALATLLAAAALIAFAALRKQQPSRMVRSGRLGWGLPLLLLLAAPTVAVMAMGASRAGKEQSVWVLVGCSIFVGVLGAAVMLLLGAWGRRPPATGLFAMGSALMGFGNLSLLYGGSKMSPAMPAVMSALAAGGEVLVVGLGTAFTAFLAARCHPRLGVLVFGVWLCTVRCMFRAGDEFGGKEWGNVAFGIGVAACFVVAGALFIFGERIRALWLDPEAERSGGPALQPPTAIHAARKS